MRGKERTGSENRPGSGLRRHCISNPRKAVLPFVLNLVTRWARLAPLQASRSESGMLTSALEHLARYESIGSKHSRAITNVPG